MKLISPPAGSTGRWVIVPTNGARAGRRAASRHLQSRRRILKLLASLVPLTFAAGLLFEGSWWEVHAAVDFLIAFYVAFLLEAKRRSAERVTKVSPLVRRTRARDRAQEREAVRALGGR